MINNMPGFTAETASTNNGGYRVVSIYSSEKTGGQIVPQRPRINEWSCNERYCCIVTLGYYGFPYLTCAERT
jgi:hypothetical protein